MTNTTITLTELERRCGVTKNAVRRTVAKSLLLNPTTSNPHVVIEAHIAPALASATAKYMLGYPDYSVDYLGTNMLGHHGYGRK